MKMIWSWYPNLGFEPRYGADIAFGAFAIANYLSYHENTFRVRSELDLVRHGIQTLWADDSFNLRTRYNIARELFKNSGMDFRDGWYSIADAELGKAEKILSLLLEELKPLVIAQELKIVVLVVTLAVIAVYLLKRPHVR